jgi:nucleotide-binding universal stress UspA family protein
MKLIVALIDFSEVTSDLITLTGKLARAMNSKVVLLHVAMPDADFVKGKERKDESRKGIASDLRRRRRALEIMELQLKKLGIEAMALMVRGDSPRGNPVGKILEEIDRLSPDLILLGSHGGGRLHRLLIGGVTDAVVRKARLPVLLVPSPPGRG